MFNPIMLTIIKTENFTNVSYMLHGCESLISLDLPFFNTENVTNIRKMFDGYSDLKSLDLKNLNKQNDIEMAYIFRVVLGGRCSLASYT